ncbi:MAG TPA: hypothetical protein VL523_05965 [Terriglobia bacterium]|nr:hypothetical protein [Terriglobia bacterium]
MPRAGRKMLGLNEAGAVMGLPGIPDGLAPAKITNITNEPSILLKRLEILPLTQHLAETKHDRSKNEPLKDPEFDRMSENSDDLAANPACY